MDLLSARIQRFSKTMLTMESRNFFIRITQQMQAEGYDRDLDKFEGNEIDVPDGSGGTITLPFTDGNPDWTKLINLSKKG